MIILYIIVAYYVNGFKRREGIENTREEKLAKNHSLTL